MHSSCFLMGLMMHSEQRQSKRSVTFQVHVLACRARTRIQVCMRQMYDRCTAIFGEGGGVVCVCRWVSGRCVGVLWMCGCVVGVWVNEICAAV